MYEVWAKKLLKRWHELLKKLIVVYSEHKARNQIKMAVRTILMLELRNLMYNAKYGKQVAWH